jgi:tetratricopeptide (TPR) repeat protein
MPLKTVPEPAPLPLGSQMPYGRNPLFVGRRQDLLTLAKSLKAGGAAAVSQVETAAATGLGGIGKTQLACEFVHRYGQYFAGGVFWLSFDHERAIPAAIAACGDAGALELRSDFALRPLEEQVRLVQAAWQEPIPRLLVFDNCEDPALLARWRPTSGGCRVLVTSRRGDWERVLGVHALPLGVLSRPESLELLRRHCPEVDVEVLDAIAAELGDLPLALHLAGSYLYRYRRAITPVDYLAQLRSPDLLRHSSLQTGGLSPTGHVQHVGRTFSLSYDRLDPARPEDALARGLLVRMAHFAPGEPVWYDLLVRTLPLPADESAANETDGAALRVAEAFDRLVELGLVETEADQVLRMHRLVAHFVRQVAGDEVKGTQQAVEQVVFDEMAHANRRNYPIPLLARQVYLRSVVDSAQPREDLQSAALCAELATYLWQVGDFVEARPYAERALAIRLALLGEDDLATAESLQVLADALRDAGELAEAKPCYERALVVREWHLGPDHPDVAETLNGLGWLLWMDRDGKPAHRCLTRALAIAERTFGRDHRLTGDYANNLGLCLQDCLGDLAGAQHYFEMALAIREQVFGPDHPLVAVSLGNLGYVLQAQGALVKARDYHARTVALRRKLWGDSHPDVAVSLMLLGRVIQDQGQLAEARTILEQALAIYIRSLGEENSRTSFCLINLGLLLQQQGDLDGAQEYLERALAVRRKTYRADHPNLAVSLDHLSALLAARGQVNVARTLLTEALTIRRAALGANHTLTQETAARLNGL